MLLSDKRSVSSQGLYYVEGRCFCVCRFAIIKRAMLKRLLALVHFVNGGLFWVNKNSY